MVRASLPWDFGSPGILCFLVRFLTMDSRLRALRGARMNSSCKATHKDFERQVQNAKRNGHVPDGRRRGGTRAGVYLTCRPSFRSLTCFKACLPFAQCFFSRLFTRLFLFLPPNMACRLSRKEYRYSGAYCGLSNALFLMLVVAM